MRAMILAAGRGERMRPLTDSTPKPLLCVGGKPLIEYHIEALVDAGVREIVINVAWLGHLIRTTLGDGARFGAKLHFSDEGKHALETGGGVFRALPLLGDAPFILLSADIWSRFPLRSLLNRPSASDLGHLVLVPNPQYHQCGDFGLRDERVQPQSVENFTYGNIGVLNPRIFEGCESRAFKLAPLLFAAAERGLLSGELFNGEWQNIGTPSQLAALNESLH